MPSNHNIFHWCSSHIVKCTLHWIKVKDFSCFYLVFESLSLRTEGWWCLYNSYFVYFTHHTHEHLLSSTFDWFCIHLVDMLITMDNRQVISSMIYSLLFRAKEFCSFSIMVYFCIRFLIVMFWWWDWCYFCQIKDAWACIILTLYI